MNEDTLTTSLGIPDSVQFDTVAGGTDIVLTYEVSDRETSEDENYTHTVWTKWDGIEDNLSTTRDEFDTWNC